MANFYGYLEIKNRRGKTDLAVEVLMKFKESGFGLHKVVFVHRCYGSPTLIPHFGHNVSCGGECRTVDDGVLRYFAVYVVTDRKATVEDLRTYEISPTAKLILSGCEVGE